jgi:hypothetical protein
MLERPDDEDDDDGEKEKMSPEGGDACEPKSDPGLKDDVDKKEDGGGEERRAEEEGDGDGDDLFTKALPLEALRRLRCWNDASSGSPPLAAPGFDSGPRLPPPGTAEKKEIDEASRRGGLNPPRRAADDEEDDDEDDDDDEEAGGPKIDPTLAADDSPDDVDCGPKSEPGSNDTEGPEDEDEDDEGKNESDDAAGSVPWLVERRLEGDDAGACVVVVVPAAEESGPNKDEMAASEDLSFSLLLPLPMVGVGEKNGSDAEDAEDAGGAERNESKGDAASELKSEVMEEDEDEAEEEEEEGEEKRMGSDMSEARSADETSVEIVDESSVLPDLPRRFVLPDFFSFLSTPANNDDAAADESQLDNSDDGSNARSPPPAADLAVDRNRPASSLADGGAKLSNLFTEVSGLNWCACTPGMRQSTIMVRGVRGGGRGGGGGLAYLDPLLGGGGVEELAGPLVGLPVGQLLELELAHERPPSLLLLLHHLQQLLLVERHRAPLPPADRPRHLLRAPIIN